MLLRRLKCKLTITHILRVEWSGMETDDALMIRHAGNAMLVPCSAMALWSFTYDSNNVCVLVNKHKRTMEHSNYVVHINFHKPKRPYLGTHATHPLASGSGGGEPAGAEATLRWWDG